jgi:hypothetical protein
VPGKTLEQLEGEFWPEPDFDSYLVTTCNRLRKKPVDEFTVEDLRIMIGQQIGLPYLVPRALDVLERDPLADGDFYDGDLLMSVIRAGSFVASSPDWLQRRLNVADQALVLLGTDDDDLRVELTEFIGRHRS